MQAQNDISCLIASQQHQIDVLTAETEPPLHPPTSHLRKAASDLRYRIPDQGLGIQRTTDHVLGTIAHALNRSSLSPNYYGFVTGGVTPAARVAENVAALYDQNVGVHLPSETACTTVENCALSLLLDLFRLDSETWSERTFTTGATSSNILGLASGREYVINTAIKKIRENSNGVDNNLLSETVGEHGLLAACKAAEADTIQILTTSPHSSLKKAASVLGLGRSSVVDVTKENDFLTFDLEKTEALLKRLRTLSIVVVSCGEVNTGAFATRSFQDFHSLRSLCDKYNAWIHVDGAFGLFARILDESPEFQAVRQGTEGLELADSITGDAHKLLNVPYDCGFFFSRHPNLAHEVFQNANAAYLNFASTSSGQIQSPLNIGIENSRRFRALPVYATLISYGRFGYRDMLQRQVRMARAVALFFHEHSEFELLPQAMNDGARERKDIYIIVLFRAKDQKLNESLVRRINSTSRIYVSGTTWDGIPASRIAVANWQVDPSRDLLLVRSVIEEVLNTWRNEMK